MKPRSAQLAVLAVVATGLLIGPVTPALAKGVAKATVAGPGLAEPVRLEQSGTADLSRVSALYQAVFPEPPYPVVARRPPGKLGPRYVATFGWLVAADRTKPVRQDLYPFAAGGALAYTPPGQRVFANGKPFKGGWYRAGAPLTDMMVSLGARRPSKT